MYTFEVSLLFWYFNSIHILWEFWYSSLNECISSDSLCKRARCGTSAWIPDNAYKCTHQFNWLRFRGDRYRYFFLKGPTTVFFRKTVRTSVTAYVSASECEQLVSFRACMRVIVCARASVRLCLYAWACRRASALCLCLCMFTFARACVRACVS